MGERAGPQVEPIPNEPAATADLDGERLLLLADYHAGIEAGLRYERGVELPDNAAERRDRLCGLLDRTDADRLVVLGDLGHRIGSPGERERAELDALFAAVVDERGVPITVAAGNHDGDLAAAVGDRAGVDVLDAAGGPHIPDTISLNMYPAVIPIVTPPSSMRFRESGYMPFPASP